MGRHAYRDNDREQLWEDVVCSALAERGEPEMKIWRDGVLETEERGEAETPLAALVRRVERLEAVVFYRRAR
ncbi:MAG: hypothetical protein LBT60_06385 [Oscillospiraceae bacterium]|jgi:hypothetical protein|nr:hypothetical protein [Oscillospiraceae bacterium]